MVPIAFIVVNASDVFGRQRLIAPRLKLHQATLPVLGNRPREEYLRTKNHFFFLPFLKKREPKWHEMYKRTSEFWYLIVVCLRSCLKGRNE